MNGDLESKGNNPFSEIERIDSKIDLIKDQNLYDSIALSVCNWTGLSNKYTVFAICSKRSDIVFPNCNSCGSIPDFEKHNIVIGMTLGNLSSDFIIGKFDKKLTKGETYTFSMDVYSPSWNFYSGVNSLNVTFYSDSNSDGKEMRQNVDITLNWNENKEDRWVRISGNFISNGSEDRIKIFGNKQILKKSKHYKRFKDRQNVGFGGQQVFLDNFSLVQLSQNFTKSDSLLPDSINNKNNIDNKDFKLVELNDTLKLIVSFNQNKFDEIITDLETIKKQIQNSISNSFDYKIFINGFTDNIGNPSDNLQLSLNRANFVKSELLPICDGKKITLNGLGENQPIGDNETDEGRTKNRRVEIIVILFKKK